MKKCACVHAGNRLVFFIVHSKAHNLFYLLSQLVIISSSSKLVFKLCSLLVLFDLCTHRLPPLLMLGLHLIHLKLLHVGLVFLREGGEGGEGGSGEGWEEGRREGEEGRERVEKGGREEMMIA